MPLINGHELPKVASARAGLTRGLWQADRDRAVVIVTLDCQGCGRMGTLGSLNNPERIAETIYGWSRHGCEERE